MKNINWGMIGCGQVTEMKSGPGLYKAYHSNLIGVYSTSYEKAVDYTKRHGIEKVYRTAEELLSDDTIDIVYIATPPVFHKQYAIACLRAGKIPYIEKPVTMTYEECLEIKNLSKELNIPVYAAFYRRGLEKFIKIKELLDNKEIGDIRYIYVTQTMQVEENELDKERLPWRVQPKISGGGKFLDMGVHVLDCLIFYFGEMTALTGNVENKGNYYEAEDTITAAFKFKNGIVGCGTWCYVADQNINEVQIVGEKGRIIYDGLAVNEFTVIKNRISQVYRFEEPKHVAMPYQQAIVNELIGKEKSFANFEEATNVVKMTDMLLKDYYSKGE